MRRQATAAAVLLLAVISIGVERYAEAQPARGAGAAIERVREGIANRFRDAKLSGDPDRDFAELLTAFYEEQLFLSKAQLEYGGDRQLREIAQKLQDERDARLDEIRQWRVRSQSAAYRAQPDQPAPGSGPLDRSERPQAQAPATPPAAQPPSTAAAPAATTPMVQATVDDINLGAGKITLDHGAIPNLGMDAMTMVFRAADPKLLRTVKKGDKVQFSADRVNGQLTVTRIQKAR